MNYDLPIYAIYNNIEFRNSKRIDYSYLYEEFYRVDWSSIYNMLSVDDQLCFLEQNIETLFNTFVPLQSNRIRSNQKPWFTTEIKRLMVDRDYAYSRWKRYKTSNLHETFRKTRNNVTKVIRVAKSKYYSEKFANLNDTKNIWKTIKEIGIGNNKKQKNNSMLI